MENISLEERVGVLEQQMQSLAELVAEPRAKPSSSRDWRKVFGSAAGDAGFEEMLRLGRKYRDRDRPIDGAGDAGS